MGKQKVRRKNQNANIITLDIISILLRAKGRESMKWECDIKGNWSLIKIDFSQFLLEKYTYFV